MKRKVNRVGISTLTVSLPSKWAKAHNIKAGDEISLIEEDDSLVLTTASKKSTEKVRIDLTNKPSSLIWGYLGSAYEIGYEEAEIIFQNQFTAYTGRRKLYARGEKVKTLDIIHKACRDLPGFEIIRQSTNYCIVKELSEIKSTDYDTLLKRIIFMIDETFEELIEYLKTKDNALAESILLREDNINKFCHMCLRALNTQGHPDHKKIQTLQRTIRVVEHMADRYQELVNRFKTKKFPKEYFDIITAAGQLQKKVYDLLFGNMDISKFYADEVFKFDNMITDAKSDTDFIPNMKQICEYFRDLVRCRIDLDIIGQK